MELSVHKLLNNYQQSFPIEKNPFDAVGRSLNCDASTVLRKLRDLVRQGSVSRVGPVFRPNSIGASTLAAMAVPSERLAEVAAIVSARPEINHNYEREHDFNLWFVATAETAAALATVLRELQRDTGQEILSLPLEKEYHIDLGFDLTRSRKNGVLSRRKVNLGGPYRPVALDPEDERIIAQVQRGLPLVSRPYRAVAEKIGLSEDAVLAGLQRLKHTGVIKRFGIVVRHRELGYRANGMVVWDFPDDVVDEMGARLAEIDCVTLCYRRPRHLPDWPYNLFCMVHGHDREEVLTCLKQMVTKFELRSVHHDILFSTRRFKQRGAQYRDGGNPTDTGANGSD